MSTYTPSLGLEEITPGTQAGLWGNTTNNNLALIDQAITGVQPIDFTGSSGVVTTLDLIDGSISATARSAVLNITGTATGSNTVVVPNKQKTYLVRNNTGQNVVFRTASPTATYTVEAGNSILIFCDGNNNVFTGIAAPSVGTLSVSAGGTGATTFTAGFVKSPGGTGALTSSSAVALASDVSGTLPVANGGTGAGSFTSGSLLIGNGTSNFGTLVGGGVGQVATWNGSTWTAATPAAGAVTSVSGSGNISVSPTTGAAVVSITSAPTFNTVYYGNTSNYISQSSNELVFITGGVQVNKFTSSGFGTTGGIAVAGRASIGGGSAGSNFNLDLLGQSGQSAMFVTTGGSSGNGIAINAVNTNSCILFQNNGVFAGSITSSGSTTSYNTTSDRRLKSNIVDLIDSGSIIDALQPRTFTWNTTKESAKGFIADELQQVIPQSVQGQPNEVDADGNPKYQTVDASTPEMIALMVAELQSLRKRVAELEAK
jgi:hypothetical protein